MYVELSKRQFDLIVDDYILKMLDQPKKCKNLQ